MKKTFLLFTILSILISKTTFSQGTIIDHNCTDISQIPSDVIDDIQENIKWHYAHTSHGRQLTCGLEYLENNDTLLDVEIGYKYLPDSAGALCIFDGQEYHTYITPEGYWLTTQGWGWTQNVLNNNPEINVSGWTWCTQLEYYPSSKVQAYLDSISSFEAAHPDVTFIYFTGNAQKNGIYGYKRYIHNQMIRQYCIDNNKVLFDFADMDCWYNGEMNYYIYEGDTIPVQHSAYNGDVCGHVNDLSCIQKGKAVWWMMAKLRGWEDGIRMNLKIFLEGPFNDTGMNTNIAADGNLPLAQPYNIAPWDYAGTESVTAIPNADVVDWVLVELRDTTDASLATGETMIARQAAFLLNDGSVVGLDGANILSFSHSVIHNLFVILWHRNHLGIMSANPVTESGGVYSYDFTTGSGKAYGAAPGQKEIAPGIWGMFGGDGDADGQVNLNDKSNVWVIQAGTKGYKSGDMDMDGKVNNPDKNDVWIGNTGSNSQVPD